MVKRFSVIRLTMLVAGATALVIVASGCGGSKKSSSGSNSTVTVTTVTTTTGSTTGSSSGSPSTSGSSTTSSGSSSSGTSVSKSCLDFAGAAAKLGEALSSTGSPAENAESTKKYFEALADKAPSDIKSAFRTFADAMSKYLDTIKGVNLQTGQTPSAADLAKLQSAAAALSTPEVRAASEKINAWVKAGCHS